LPYPQAPPAATAAEEEPLSMEKKPNELEKQTSDTSISSRASPKSEDPKRNNKTQPNSTAAIVLSELLGS
jgi:hypothetical protein